MPGSLKLLKRDPNKKGRGVGLYYHRGRGYFSKYSEDRDRKIQAKGWKLNRVGLPVKSKIKQTSDGKLPR